MAVKVVTDSGCDLPQALCDELGIDVVPLTVRFGTTELVDRVDLDSEGFWERCASSPSLPETAAPSPGAFDAAYRRAADAGADGIVVVTLSRKMSATIQAAELAAESFQQLPVRVVDSQSASAGEGLVALEAARLAATGASVDEVAGHAEKVVPRVTLYATLDTLDNLRKGGRIGGAQALLGGLLSIKPLITVVDGQVEEASKQRTRGKALAALYDRLRGLGTPERLVVMHARAQDLPQVLDAVAAVYPRDDLVVTDVGAVIGTHVGPGCVGFAALRA